MSKTIRTDLAMEAAANAGQIPGVSVLSDEVAKGLKRVRVTVETEEGERAVGKKRGIYVTLEAPELAQGDTELDEGCSKALAEEIRHMAGDAVNGCVLVVGLGNRQVTPDALGPAVCDEVFVSRHMHEYAPNEIDERIGNVSAIAPGVLGITGIETGEIISGVVDYLKPSLVIAVDSLASQALERIRTTVQVADAGIAPGAGIGNKRKALNRESLGVPVLAVGVPLVVYASTIVQDLMETALEKAPMDLKMNDKLQKVLAGMNDVDGADMIVTPKEIDKVVEDMARIIADALNLALHNKLTLEETRRYMH